MCVRLEDREYVVIIEGVFEQLHHDLVADSLVLSLQQRCPLASVTKRSCRFGKQWLWSTA